MGTWSCPHHSRSCQRSPDLILGPSHSLLHRFEISVLRSLLDVRIRWCSQGRLLSLWRDPVSTHGGKCTTEAQARVLASRGGKGYLSGTCPQSCPRPGPSRKPPLLLQVAGNTFPCNLIVQGCDTFWLNNTRSDELKEEFSKNNNSCCSQRSQYTHGDCWPTLTVCAKPSMAPSPGRSVIGP